MSNDNKYKEHSHKLQEEFIDSINRESNQVYVINKWEIEILQKLPIETSNKSWSEEDKKAIQAYTDTIHYKVHDYINSLLDEDSNLGLLEFVSGTKDAHIDLKISELKSELHELVETL